MGEREEKKSVVLSERLKALTDMVTRGNRVVDVGCDHGFVSIYLVEQHISPGVLAMDVRKGPLSGAEEHIAERGLQGQIQTRLSDGLQAFSKGEAQTMICAGMGGKLMMKILTDSREKARSLDELILQPQSELPLFRSFLDREGYRVLDENILQEEGKYYFLFKVKYNSEGIDESDCSKRDENHNPAENLDVSYQNSELNRRFGRLLLQQKHPVLKEYLLQSERVNRQILQNLSKGEGTRAQGRIKEVRDELFYIEEALKRYEKDF